MPPLCLIPSPPEPACDCCRRPLAPDRPVATLAVAGPDDRTNVRVLGNYCGECWKQLSAALDVLEELGRLFGQRS